MASLNKVQIIGYTGKDPEMRFTPNGNPVTNFSVAVSRSYTKDDEKRQETEWFSVVTWNKLAEVCNQYIVKGMAVYVEGRLRTRSWEGDDGVKRYKTEVIANQVQFLERKRDSVPAEDTWESPPF